RGLQRAGGGTRDGRRDWPGKHHRGPEHKDRCTPGRALRRVQREAPAAGADIPHKPT
ncbi:unnamed protein product, partial [Heterosigma akashiwo]